MQHDIFNEYIKNSVQFKQILIKKYAASWIQFFPQFKDQNTTLYHNMMSQNQRLKGQNEKLFIQYSILYNESVQLKKNLDILTQEMQIMKTQRIQREERALKRKHAQRQLIRESVTEHEFHAILDMVKHNHFVASRKKTALILLYVTGLRVSNLLKLTIQNIEDFLNKGETRISIIKRGNKNHPILLSKKSRILIKEHTINFTQLMRDKERDSFFFTTQTRLDKPISRSSFDAELNNVLVKASQTFNKHIRTHSFRASIITDFLKSTPVDIVKQIVGHKDIATTLQYKRGVIDQIQFKNILHNLDLQRSKEGSKTMCL